MTGIKFLFLVGGFSESPMLQQEIRSEFKHLVQIIIPAEVSLAVVKGQSRVFLNTISGYFLPYFLAINR